MSVGISNLCLNVLFQIFICGWSPGATCLLWAIRLHIHCQIITTYKDSSMRVKICTALVAEMCIRKQFKKKHFNQLYQIWYISTKISVAACNLRWEVFTIYKAVPNLEKGYWLFRCDDHYEQQWGLQWTIGTRVCLCKIKLELNILGGSTFTSIFLQVKHAGAAVLYKLFWTHWLRTYEPDNQNKTKPKWHTNKLA